MAQLYYENDNVLIIKSVRDIETGDIISDATFSAKIYQRKTGILVPGGEVDFSPAETSGEYHAILLRSEVQMTLGTEVKVVINSSSHGIQIVRYLPVVERVG